MDVDHRPESAERVDLTEGVEESGLLVGGEGTGVFAPAQSVLRLFVAGNRCLVVVSAGPEAGVIERVGHVPRRPVGRVVAIDVSIWIPVVLGRLVRVLDRLVVVGILVWQLVPVSARTAVTMAVASGVSAVSAVLRLLLGC
jgi:hypothetical protein